MFLHSDKKKRSAVFSGATVAKWHRCTQKKNKKKKEKIHFRCSKSLSSAQYSVEVKQAFICVYFNNVVRILEKNIP